MLCRNQSNRNTRKSILLLADECVKQFQALHDEDIKDVVLIQRFEVIIIIEICALS